MNYMLLIYEPESAYEGEAGRDVLAEALRKHMALWEEMGAAGVRVGGGELKPTRTATTVRTLGGVQSVHDGPFAETREQLGGFYLIDAPDLDEALAWARKIPVVDGGKVEVRPLGDA